MLLLAPAAAIDWPEAELLFLLGRLLGHLALGTWVSARRSAVELELLLAAAAKIQVREFSIDTASEETLDAEVQRFRKILTSEIIGSFASAAKIYAKSPRPDFESWLLSMDLAAARTGLMVCGDLSAALAALAREAAPTEEASVRTLLQESPRARDLFLWSLSDESLMLRRQAGLGLLPAPRSMTPVP
jgi:hypothetical protein